MPAAVAETDAKPDHSEQMMKVLKAHILRERARKKQEREAEVEEERLRKEREAREQQNVMTLGETREQISQLEAKLQQLKEEKHQLFLQLKKVLNEDENRRRQLVKEHEMLAMQPLVPQQLYITPQMPRTTQVQQPQSGFKPPIKRPRSPSPPPSVPVSMYPQGYGYKPPTVATNAYQSSPQKDDGRRHDLARAVLWNKAPQYSNQPGPACYYPPSDLSIYYPQSPLAGREGTRSVYEPPRSQPYHIEPKMQEHYGLRPQVSHGHVIHGASIPINTSQMQPKPGGISTGYPVRNQTQYQQMQSGAPALYTAQSRPLYPPGTPMNYPPRE